MFGGIKAKIKRYVMWNWKTQSLVSKWRPEKDSGFMAYRRVVSEHKDVKYEMRLIDIPQTEAKHKWVGAQVFHEHMYAIPNDMNQILICHGNTAAYIGELGNELFKWTGGCVWNGYLYGFPRTSNSFLKMNLCTQEISELPLSEHYMAEHHYGGVCTKDGIVYQPPRNTDHILATDLKNGRSWKIQIALSFLRMRLRYCGSILHPNGFVYFFPERDDRIIKLDVETERWTFIGKPVSTMAFDAKIALDGNIYGYSAYARGIMKIDVYHDTVEMIHTEIVPGAYGTKLGLNGCLYSVPGDGQMIWEFNPADDTLKKLLVLDSDKKAKYAGGAVTEQGDIYFVPAQAENILLLSSNADEIVMPEETYREYFTDCY